MRLDLRVVDLGAAESALRAPDRLRQNLAATSPNAWWTSRSRLPGLSSCSSTAPGARASAGRVIGRQLLDFEFDQRERPLGGLLVDRRHRRDRLAAIAHAPARQRIFVHGDRQHAVGVRAVVAGDDRHHALERARLGHVEPNDVAVADRAAQDAPDQRVGVVEVGGVAGAAGDLVDAVDQRHAAARELAVGDRVGGHVRVSAAALTDSMIFT